MGSFLKAVDQGEGNSKEDVEAVADGTVQLVAPDLLVPPHVPLAFMIIITKKVMKRSRKRMRMRRMVMVTMIKVYHLPKTPVRYPSDCNSFGQVVALGGRPTYNTVFKNLISKWPP